MNSQVNFSQWQSIMSNLTVQEIEKYYKEFYSFLKYNDALTILTVIRNSKVLCTPDKNEIEIKCKVISKLYIIFKEIKNSSGEIWNF